MMFIVNLMWVQYHCFNKEMQSRVIFSHVTFPRSDLHVHFLKFFLVVSITAIM